MTSNTQQNPVEYSLDQRGVAFVTLNRPQKHNAFDDNMIQTLTHHFESAATDSKVRVLVLQAQGKNFCAGADLSWMQKMVNYSEQDNQADALKLATMLDTLYHFPKPTIARVQGAAFGGAVGLVACCDIAIASKLSKFCLSEVRLGLIPATIGQYVIKAMGERNARRYFMTAEVFSARRARRLGLVSESVSEDELDSHIDDIIQALLKNGPNAVSEAKSLALTLADSQLNAQTKQYTSETIARIRVSEEGQEGLNAFLQNRSPSWIESNND